MLILDRDAETLTALRALAEQLHGARIEMDSRAGVRAHITVRRPTIAVVAVNRPKAILSCSCQRWPPVKHDRRSVRWSVPNRRAYVTSDGTFGVSA